MPDWILLLPIVFPFLGALIFTPIAPRMRPRIRTWLPILLLTIEILAILVNIAPGSHRLVLSKWELASFSIALQMDGITQLLLLTVFVPLVALSLVAPRRAPFDLFSTIVLTAAILLISADNLVTAYIAWAFFDLAIFLWRLARDIERDTALRAVAIGQFTGLILVAGIVLLGSGQTGTGAWLVALAYWARLGLFPFHYLLPTRGVDAFDLWFARGIPLIAAASLWLRWPTLRIDAPITLIGVLAAVALSAAVVWIWREEMPMRAIVVCVPSAIALIPLAIVLGGDAAVALGLWLTLTTVVAIALGETALRWRADNLNRWPRLVWFAAMLSLAGLPLTPAFLGRVGLAVALWESNNWLLMLMVGTATLVILAPLWRFGFALKGSETREPFRVEYAGLAILVVTCAALGLLPMLIAHALSPAAGESAERAIDLVIRTNDALGVGIGIVMLLAPIVGSYFLQTSIRTFQASPGSLTLRVAKILDLEWLERLLAAIGFQTGSIARNAVTLAEENPTVWVLFIALWIAIFIAMAR